MTTTTHRQLNYKALYQRITLKGDVEKIVNELTFKLPEYNTDLQTFQAHIYMVNDQNLKGVITAERYNVSRNRIDQAIISFLDELSKGQGDVACRHLQIGNEANSVFDEVIDGQLEFSQNAVKENKVFRMAVGLIFLTAIAFSIVVTIDHIEFLAKDFSIIALLGLNVLLYICIGILALFALTLIIKGSVINQRLLNFSRKSLKRKL